MYVCCLPGFLWKKMSCQSNIFSSVELYYHYAEYKNCRDSISVKAVVATMLLQKIVISVIFSLCFLRKYGQAAKIEIANMWLHHQMDPFELSHHFGVESSQQVDPESYQVITINTATKNPGSSKSKKSSRYELHTTYFLNNFN